MCACVCGATKLHLFKKPQHVLRILFRAKCGSFESYLIEYGRMFAKALLALLSVYCLAIVLYWQRFRNFPICIIALRSMAAEQPFPLTSFLTHPHTRTQYFCCVNVHTHTHACTYTHNHRRNVCMFVCMKR